MNHPYEIIQPKRTPYYLPIELWNKIFLEFSFFGISKMARMCKDWNKYINKHSLWLKLYQEYFPHKSISSSFHTKVDEMRFAFETNYLSMDKEEKNFLSEFWLGNQPQKDVFPILTSRIFSVNSFVTAQCFLNFLVQKQSLNKIEIDHFIRNALCFSSYTQQELDERCKSYEYYIYCYYGLFLYLAMKHERWDAVVWLLKTVDTSLSGDNLDSNFILQAIKQEQPDVAIALMHKGENVNFYVKKLNKDMFALALELGQIEVAKALIQSDRFKRHKEAFIIAIEHSQTKLIDILQHYLLHHGIALDAQTIFQMIALGALDRVHLFLNQNNFDYVCLNSRNTCLHLAATLSDPNLLMALIFYAENTNKLKCLTTYQNKNGYTPLALAIKKAQLQNINILFEKSGYPEEIVLVKGSMIFHKPIIVYAYECNFYSGEAILEYLIKPANPDVFNQNQYETLLDTYFEYPVLFCRIIEKLQDLYEKNSEADIGLQNFVSSYLASVKIPDSLFDETYDLNPSEKWPKEAQELWKSIFSAEVSNVQAAITRGARIAYLENKPSLVLFKDKDQNTWLHLIIEHIPIKTWDQRKALVEIAHCLIQAGLDINAQNIQGQTPLHLALEKCSIWPHTSIGWCHFLLGHSHCVLSLHNTLGQSVLHLAAQKGVIDVFLKGGWTIEEANVKDLHQKTPLHNAIFYEHTDIIHYLIEKGIALEDLNEEKNNLFHVLFAKYLTHKELIVQLLKDLPVPVAISLLKQKNYKQKSCLDLFLETTVSIYKKNFYIREMIKYHLRHVPECIDEIDKNGNTLLHRLILTFKGSDLNFLKLFPQLQSLLTKVNKEKQTPLLLAAATFDNNSNVNSIYLFMHENFSDKKLIWQFEQLDSYGNNFLYYLLLHDNYEILEFLEDLRLTCHLPRFFLNQVLKILESKKDEYSFNKSLIAFTKIKVFQNNFLKPDHLGIISIDLILGFKDTPLLFPVLKNIQSFTIKNLDDSETTLIESRRKFIIKIIETNNQESREFLRKFIYIENFSYPYLDNYQGFLNGLSSSISLLKTLEQIFPENPLWKKYALQLRDLNTALKQSGDDSRLKDLNYFGSHLLHFFQFLLRLQTVASVKKDPYELTRRINAFQDTRVEINFLYYCYCGGYLPLTKPEAFAINIVMGLLLGAAISSIVICPVVFVSLHLTIASTLAVILLSSTIAGTAALGASTAGVLTAKHLHVGRFFKTDFERKYDCFVSSLDAHDILQKTPLITR